MKLNRKAETPSSALTSDTGVNNERLIGFSAASAGVAIHAATSTSQPLARLEFISTSVDGSLGIGLPGARGRAQGRDARTCVPSDQRGLTDSTTAPRYPSRSSVRIHGASSLGAMSRPNPGSPDNGNRMNAVRRAPDVRHADHRNGTTGYNRSRHGPFRGSAAAGITGRAQVARVHLAAARAGAGGRRPRPGAFVRTRSAGLATLGPPTAAAAPAGPVRDRGSGPARIDAGARTPGSLRVPARGCVPRLSAPDPPERGDRRGPSRARARSRGPVGFARGPRTVTARAHGEPRRARPLRERARTARSGVAAGGAAAGRVRVHVSPDRGGARQESRRGAHDGRSGDGPRGEAHA